MVHGRFYARPDEDKAEWFTAEWWMSGEISRRSIQGTLVHKIGGAALNSP
jgi:hypothetical protein